MSFTRDVKQELASVDVEDCCLKAELYSFVLLRSTIKVIKENPTISFSTNQINVARRIIFLLRKLYDIKVDLTIKKKEKTSVRSFYWININNQVSYFLEDLKIVNSKYKKIKPQYVIEKDCCKASILRGAFLARGSINNPNSNEYHLEIRVPSNDEGKFLKNILEEINITAKIITRAKRVVLYIKKGEQIADFLKYVGANNSLFVFEDIRIKKDINNYVNRIMNCDVANEQKAIASAAKQIENIEYLDNNYGFSNLTPRLVDAIILRTNFPDDSLSQLSERSIETVNRYISKSGLSHCFKDIERLVSKTKKNKL